MSGLLGDELINTETFPTRIEIDRRNTQITKRHHGRLVPYHQPRRRSVEFAALMYEQFAPRAERRERVSGNDFTVRIRLPVLRENWCSGVPFSTINDDGTFTFGQALTGPTDVRLGGGALHARADAALALDPQPPTRAASHGDRAQYWLATVGLARATLDETGATAAAAVITAATPAVRERSPTP